MFERDAHRRVHKVLAALEGERLERSGFLFGGGTRIVLELGEYRVSEDVDFLCSDPAGYADLRLQVSQDGYKALFGRAMVPGLDVPREVRIDQYGLRFPAILDGERIKVELIREARIALDAGVRPAWSPVACLSIADCFAEKLLANSDRWADRQVLSRDLIDLGALRSHFGAVPEAAWAKVDAAYKGAARADLRRAAIFLLENEPYRERCLQSLRIELRAEILDGVSALRAEA